MPPTSKPPAGKPGHTYSTAYVAQRLGVSVPTVQRWVDAGHLKAWKTLGGHRRIDGESAEILFRTQHLPDEAPPPNVVIVDDNPDDRELLAALCETALPGSTVVLAENGFQGLVAIGQSEPAVVITDIVMPKMDGFEMLNQLSAHCAVKPRALIAVSSQPPETLFKFQQLPEGVHFASKPLEPDAFIDLLRTAFGRRPASPAPQG